MKYVKIDNVYVNLEKVRVFYISGRDEGGGITATFYYDQNLPRTELNISEKELKELEYRACAYE